MRYNNVDSIFYIKGFIHHEFTLGNQIVTGNFYKEVIKRLMAQVQCVRPKFWENGSWYHLHHIALVHLHALSPSF
jgi:hypothetical protein